MRSRGAACGIVIAVALAALGAHADGDLTLLALLADQPPEYGLMYDLAAATDAPAIDPTAPAVDADPVVTAEVAPDGSGGAVKLDVTQAKDVANATDAPWYVDVGRHIARHKGKYATGVGVAGVTYLAVDRYNRDKWPFDRHPTRTKEVNSAPAELPTQSAGGHAAALVIGGDNNATINIYVGNAPEE